MTVPKASEPGAGTLRDFTSTGTSTNVGRVATVGHYVLADVIFHFSPSKWQLVAYLYKYQHSRQDAQVLVLEP